MQFSLIQVLIGIWLFGRGSTHTCFDNFDTIQPIVKISPAKEKRKLDDRFGFSVTVHQTQDVQADDSMRVAIQKTVLMIGAPNGKFPGGISGIEIDSLACAESRTGSFEATTQEERMACLANLTTGLVYQCPLNESDCGAALGNGSARAADGYLFDRIGNDPDIITARINNDDGDENKESQAMGFNVYSNKGVFVACAPMWEHIGFSGSEPRGRCVYSNQSLTDFTVLRPCQRGTAFNQNEEGFCLTGFGVEIKEGVSTVEIAIGTPGRTFSRGGVVYYEDASDMTEVDGTKESTVLPSIGPGDLAGRRSYTNTPNGVSYYGFSFAEGYITNNISTSFLVGAPRYSEQDFLGYVFIIPNNGDYKAHPSKHISGKQFGEMFGYSIAALDINNDGFDDVVVGAPIYGEISFAELGRVFVFENNKGNGFLEPVTIKGYKKYSRFGTVVAGIGDLNNDGFKDFAVSAPYEGSGVVYVYYGQERDSAGSIVDTQYKQRIDGAAFVDRVSNLTEVKMFGFSLSGSVDVDNNQYNDLVVGAYDSQAVFVLRSRPFASFSVNFSSVSGIDPDSQCCSFNNKLVTCFIYTLCAEYTGKGIAAYFDVNYRIEETSTPQRVFFDAQIRHFTIGMLKFYGERNSTCIDGLAYLMDNINPSVPVSLSAKLSEIDRPEVIVDTTLTPPDLSASPVIDSHPTTIEVAIGLASYNVSVYFGSNSVFYQGNHTPSVNNIANNLGESLMLTASFTNQGSISIHAARLKIYIPTRSIETGDFYFYYPATLASSEGIVCSMDGINPDNLAVTANKTTSENEKSSIPTEQSSVSLNMSCDASSDQCVEVTCNITDLGLAQTANVTITGFLDERFYNHKSGTYMLEAYVTGDVLNSSTNCIGPDKDTVLISKHPIIIVSRCKLLNDSGPCHARGRRYYYNNISKECKTFLWGGCGGNDNRFLFKHTCEEECSECPPTCSTEFCVTKRTAICTISKNATNSSCPGGCVVSNCLACVYHDRPLPPVNSSSCLAKCTTPRDKEMKFWGRCLRRCFNSEIGKIPVQRTKENFKCWEYPCLE